MSRLTRLGARLEAHIRTTPQGSRGELEDRQDLLGHRSGRMTTYSAAELSKLIEAADRVCERSAESRPELVVLRRLSVS